MEARLRTQEDPYGQIPRSEENIAPLITCSVSRVYDPLELLNNAVDTAEEYGITVYDALLVTLAKRGGYKVASFDTEHREALKARGLDIT